jgi:hypothetical protein
MNSFLGPLCIYFFNNSAHLWFLLGSDDLLLDATSIKNLPGNLSFKIEMA